MSEQIEMAKAAIEKNCKLNDIDVNLGQLQLSVDPANLIPVIDFVKNLEAKDIFKDKIVTEVNNTVPFYEAEDYHHDYFTKNPQNAYCLAVINPKLRKLRLNFSDLISEQKATSKYAHKFLYKVVKEFILEKYISKEQK